jgi:hypothetical protein
MPGWGEARVRWLGHAQHEDNGIQTAGSAVHPVHAFPHANNDNAVH